MSGSDLQALIGGATTTLMLTSIGAVGAVVLAVLAGVGRMSPNPLLRTVVGTYVEIFRGTSAFVQIYYMYFVLPLFGLTLPAFATGALVISLNGGAYGSEIVRGALVAIHRGQYEAALALNMTRRLALRRVIGPQAVANAFGPFGNLAIDILKGTALVSVIGIQELAFTAKSQAYNGGRPLATYGVTLLLYFLMGLAISRIVGIVESRIKARWGVHSQSGSLNG
jgi:polar amino acid transport system permease protein